MARKGFPSDKQDQYMVRLPDGMRDELKAVAARAGRSLNAEIVSRLEDSFLTWPRVSVPPAVQEMARIAGPDRRQIFDKRLNDAALEIALNVFPRGDENVASFITAFGELIYDAPEDRRKALTDMFVSLLKSAEDLLSDDGRYTIEQLEAAVELERGLLEEEAAANK